MIKFQNRLHRAGGRAPGEECLHRPRLLSPRGTPGNGDGHGLQEHQGRCGQGNESTPYPKPALLYHMMLKWVKEDWEEKVGRRRWGHSVSMPERYYNTTEGIKNKQLGWDPICDLSNPLKLEQGAKLWSNACNLCHVGCKTPYLRRNPPLAPTIGELRHDNGGGWNANVMIPATTFNAIFPHTWIPWVWTPRMFQAWSPG